MDSINFQYEFLARKEGYQFVVTRREPIQQLVMNFKFTLGEILKESLHTFRQIV